MQGSIDTEIFPNVGDGFEEIQQKQTRLLLFSAFSLSVGLHFFSLLFLAVFVSLDSNEQKPVQEARKRYKLHFVEQVYRPSTTTKPALPSGNTKILNTQYYELGNNHCLREALDGGRLAFCIKKLAYNKF